jgi:hypothetical protein
VPTKSHLGTGLAAGYQLGTRTAWRDGSGHTVEEVEQPVAATTEGDRGPQAKHQSAPEAGLELLREAA